MANIKKFHELGRKQAHQQLKICRYCGEAIKRGETQWTMRGTFEDPSEVWYMHDKCEQDPDYTKDSEHAKD